MNGKEQEQVRRDPGRPRGAPELFKSLNVPVEQLVKAVLRSPNPTDK